MAGKKGKSGRPSKKSAKPATFDKSKVTTTPYPRVAENKEFERIVSQDIPPEQGTIPPCRTDQAVAPAPGQALGLNVTDIAEWIKWPFFIWAGSQKIKAIEISDKEAISVAEPLTRILNRHGVSEYISPDILDGSQVVGRLTPIMKRRFDYVKAERSRRSSEPGQGGPAPNNPQGLPLRKPVEG